MGIAKISWWGLWTVLSVFPFAVKAEVCFSFQDPAKVSPLPIPGNYRPSSASGAQPGDQVASREREGGGYSGAVKGTVSAPIEALVTRLQDIRTIKDPGKVDLVTEKEVRPGWLFFQRVRLTAHPFFFVSVEWEEEWGFKVLAGTAQKPVKVLIVYQKRSGTSHLRHFCGSIQLTQTKPGETLVELVEEIDAPGRSEQDTLNGHLGTLQTLRKQ